KVHKALRPAAVVAAHTYLVTALSQKEVSGAERTLPAATLAGTAVVAAAATVPVRTRAATPAPVRRGFAAALVGWYAARFGNAQRRAWDKPSAEHVRRAVGAGITSLPALQGALTAAAGHPVLGTALASADPVGRRLARAVSPT
ncbi:MAG TPA: 4-hydroxybenzoate polyprenyltransferase, partial [Micromonosporaceae bacterium]